MLRMVECKIKFLLKVDDIGLHDTVYSQDDIHKPLIFPFYQIIRNLDEEALCF